MNKLKLCVLLSILMLVNLVVAAPKTLDQIVAIVDDDIILYSQLVAKVNEIKANIIKQNTNLPADEILTKQVLDNLIIENLQLQKGARYGIRITDAELNEALANIAHNNNLTLEKLYQAAQKDGLSANALRQNITNELIINKVRQYEISDQIQVSAQEITNFLAENAKIFNIAEEYNLANILIALPFNASQNQVQSAYTHAVSIYNQALNGKDFRQLALANSAGDNALKGGIIGWRKLLDLPNPFNQIIADLKEGELTEPIRTPNGFMLVKVLAKRNIDLVQHEFKVRHILLKPNELRDDNETYQLIMKLAIQIKNGVDATKKGVDFGAFAMKYSEDYGSAANAGNLDWVNPNTLVPEFRQAVQNLPLHKVSNPIKTQFGWHILEVLDKREVDVATQMQEHQVRQILHNRKYESELQTWLSKLKDEAYIEIKI